MMIARRFNAGKAMDGLRVPEGRLKKLAAFSRPFGTEWGDWASNPALKRRAILGCPSGTSTWGL